MKLFSFLFLFFLTTTSLAHADAGFVVGKDTLLASPSSKLLLATHNGHHVLTLMPVIAGDKQDAAWLIPVPSSVMRSDIRTVKASLFDAFDALTAPRLMVDQDANPCTGADTATKATSSALPNQSLDTAYDISMLSAAEAAKLPEFLEKEGYKLPERGDKILEPYTQKGLSFVIAKFRFASSEPAALPPLQIAYDAKTVSLPVRLSLLNAPVKAEQKPQVKEIHSLNAAPDGNTPREKVDALNDNAQELTILVLTAGGRASSPTLRSIPFNSSRIDSVLPALARDKFPAIAQRALAWRAKAEGALLIEYAGAAELADDQLKEAGVAWVNNDQTTPSTAPRIARAGNENLVGGMMLPGPSAALYGRTAKDLGAVRKGEAAQTNGKPFLTRLYLRYNPVNLPRDLQIQDSGDQTAIATVHHVQLPWQDDGKTTCDALQHYKDSLATREAHADQLLRRLTGLSAEDWAK